ncbi:MAG: hypothetical protein ABMA15_12025 [Vicinamibacterales bacterium]
MHLDAELVDRHPVLDIAIEPVGLLNEKDAAGRRIAAQERDHVAEGLTAGTLGGLDVLELLNDVNVFAACVLGQQLALR